MSFPSHVRHPVIGSTLSLGQSEVLRAMAHVDHRRLGLTAAQVARALSAGLRRPSTSAVTTVLAAISTTYVTTAGSTYTLTRAGLKRAVHPRARPHLFAQA